MLLSVKSLKVEVIEWSENSCKPDDRQKLFSAWYHLSIPLILMWREDINFLIFSWTLDDTLLNIKDEKSKKGVGLGNISGTKNLNLVGLGTPCESR